MRKIDKLIKLSRETLHETKKLTNTFNRTLDLINKQGAIEAQILNENIELSKKFESTMDQLIKQSYEQFPCGSFDDDPKCNDENCECKKN